MTSLEPRLDEPKTYFDHSKQVFLILQDHLEPNTTTTLQSAAASITAMLPKDAPESTEVWMFGELADSTPPPSPYHPRRVLKVSQVFSTAISDFRR